MLDEDEHHRLQKFLRGDREQPGESKNSRSSGGEHTSSRSRDERDEDQNDDDNDDEHEDIVKLADDGIQVFE